MAHFAVLDSAVSQWDGNQWWADSELPIANNHVINWRVIN